MVGLMKVGVPSEVKNHEYRVAITPSGVNEFSRHGHEVLVQAGAGLGSSITDEEFVAAGATIADDHDQVWAEAEMILKVKEPIAIEYDRMRPGQMLFTYLHLAASRDCTHALLDQKVTGIAYETVQLPSGALPLLAPMSEVAGRLAPQVGAYHLMRQGGGRGTLMGGVSGVYAAKVVVIGAGVSGMNAAAIALGHAGRGAAAGPQHRQAPRGRPDLPGTPADHRLQRVRGGTGGARCRSGHRRGAGARRQGADADQQRAGVADAAGQRAGRHRDRPGRLLRGLPADHARRPDLSGAQLGLLLRGQHARRGAATPPPTR